MSAAIAWKIVSDTARYRLAKREAGNLATSMTLGVALALPWGDLAYRFAFGAVLNLFVYLVNDCFDVDLDREAPGRDSSRARFLGENLKVAIATSVAIGLGLAAMAALHSVGLLVSLGSTIAVIIAYSAWLKRRPIVDVLAMAGWGVSMALVGFPVGSAAGWRFAGLLALLCMVTEAIQVIRDESSDRAAGVRTTAVVLGARSTAALGRLLVIASSAYAVLFLHRYVGLALLLVLPAPLTAERASRSWDIYRAVFGLTWLALLAAYVQAGSLDGLLP